MRTPRLATSLGAVMLAALAAVSAKAPAAASPPPEASRIDWRVFPDGTGPNDPRLTELRTLDTHCPYTPPASLDAWRARRDALRRQIRVALGLWPWPDRTPLHPITHGVVDRGEYTVERVIIESVPGHYVTGDVYRPAGRPGRLPAVLTPHGHWPGGRFETRTDEETATALRTGAEPFEASARHPMQARAVHLARMGIVTFLFDMEGYGDSVQIPQAVAHGYKAHRPEMEGARGWGFFSPQAELRLISVMGQQAWNAIRALDYLASRDDVDPERIGVTGESGGATQTLLLAALDERPRAFFPAVMVSTRMQGGCTCENASYLRIGTSNVEIAALAAPRPLGMTAADDWTRTLHEDGFPELQRVYAMAGAPDRVQLRSFPQFPHNFNGPSRAVMYAWFNEHLQLGWNTVPDERPFTPLTKTEASVWTEGTPADRGVAHERRLVSWWAQEARQLMATLAPTNAPGLATFRREVGGAWSVLLGGSGNRDEPIEIDTRAVRPLGWARVTLAAIRRSASELPAVILSPGATAKGVIVWIAPEGKDALRDGPVAAAVRQAVAAGYEVLGVDVLGQGELRAGDGAFTVRLASPRPHAGYTFGYNLPVPAERTQDVLHALRAARDRVGPSGRVLLYANGPAAAWAAGARALAPALVDRAVLAFEGFRFGAVSRIDDPDFLPGSVKYGDVPALVALAAPADALVLDPGADANGYRIAIQAYAAAGREDALGLAGRDTAAAIRWLTAPPTGDARPATDQ